MCIIYKEKPKSVQNSQPASALQRKRLPRKRRIEKITEETLNKHVSESRRSSANYSQYSESPIERDNHGKFERTEKEGNYSMVNTILKPFYRL